MERPELVLSLQHTVASEAHTGQVQHSSRPDVPSRQTDLHRVVPESGNSKQDFPDHGLSINRPVHHMSEQQAAILCVIHTGSEGAINRCPHDGLESHTCIGVSTVPSYTSCDKQSTVLSELIKSFVKQRPVDRPLAPKWDLAFVLSHMCKAPFEPLDKASLFHLSVKTVFLVTLATARIVSEVHAFSIDSDHLRFSNLDGSLILRT